MITTTRQLQDIPSPYYIKVNALEPVEAIELAQTLILGTSVADATILAEKLDHHVLAITLACGMINQDEHATVPDFCTDLTRAMAAVFDGEHQDQYPALTQIYRRILSDLAETNPHALRALELMVFLHDSDIHGAIIVLSLSKALGLVSENLTHQKAIARKAMNALVERYLVEAHDGTYTVPQLSRTMISQLVHERGAELCQYLQEGILALVVEARREFSSLSLMEFLNQIGFMITHFTTTYIDPMKTGGLLDYVYTYAEAISDLLRSLEEDPWRLALVALEQQKGSFPIMCLELSKETDSVSDLVMEVNWEDPEPHKLTVCLRGWDKRKKMQVIVVPRSGVLDEEISRLKEISQLPVGLTIQATIPKLT